MIHRTLSDSIRRSKKSILLLGPRQTGKSTLIRALSPDLEINLASEATYLEFARNPRELEQRLAARRCRTVFIDEVQRLPALLNTVQALIDEAPKPLKFFLTGSSARKLKRGNANLLPGRIHHFFLGPLVASERGYQLDVKEALSTGTLPGIWTESDRTQKRKTLATYAATYLKEEIQAEALAKGIEGFSRFLFVVAAESGKFLDLSKLASQAAIPRQSAIRYLEVLEDTLIVRRCETFRNSERRRLVQSPRFFFFDTGVLNGLMENFEVSADRIGRLFEHLLFNQIMDSARSLDQRCRVSSYRTEHGAEVDFILEMPKEVIAVEAKASWNIGKVDVRGFKSFAEYYSGKHRRVIVYLGDVSKVIDGIEILPWQIFLKQIGL